MSVTSHSTERAKSTPIKGGSPVNALKMGTKTKPPVPSQKTSCAPGSTLIFLGSTCVRANFPLTCDMYQSRGTSNETSEGKKRDFITAIEESRLLIQSM